MSKHPVQISYGKGFEPLLDVLSKVKRPGSWFSTGGLETAMPTLKVTGVGVLSFPLPPAQARKLIKVAGERAPYGRGDKTLVDETVRKVWQVPTAQVSIGGASWMASLDSLVERVADELGCEGVQVEAEFYKLLVYEKGGFFLPHRDSEKSGGMFGTLVITLPSEHEGGELVIRHSGRETVADLRGAEASEIRYAAFYADCEHEVRPILSGYRVCLVYNLVQRGRKAALQAPDHREASERVALLLDKWAEGSQEPDKIVYLLAHHYTQAALSFSALKGADAALAQVLVPAAAEAGCAIHLGIVHIEESGWAEYTGGYSSRRYGRGRWRGGDDEDDEDEEDSADYEVGEVCDGSYYIDQWRTPGGRLADFGAMPIREGELLPPGALDDEPPDESHFSEATGNAGASFERTYLRAALILWPEARYDQICAASGTDAAIGRLEELVDTVAKSSRMKREEAADAVRRYAKLLPAIDDRVETPSGSVNRLLSILLRFSDPELLVEVTEPALVRYYDGRQNDHLVAAAGKLHPSRAAEFLVRIIEARGPAVPSAVIALCTALATGGAGKPHGQILSAVLDAFLKVAANYQPRKEEQWIRRWKLATFGEEDLDDDLEDRAEKPPTPEVLSAFLIAIHKSACGGKLGAIVHCITEKPELFPPQTVVLPALENVGRKIKPDAGLLDLWTHCASYYLRRSERAPEPPRDWKQEVRIPGNAPHLRELQEFAQDPEAQVYRFALRKELRQEIHQLIDREGLDMTHVTERVGRPQTLVCTKTRASYDRACERYRRDLADMQRLMALATNTGANGSELLDRLQRACSAVPQKSPRKVRAAADLR